MRFQSTEETKKLITDLQWSVEKLKIIDDEWAQTESSV